MADILPDVLVTFCGVTILSPKDRIEGESLTLADEFATTTRDLCGADFADVSANGNCKGTFDLSTVQAFRTPAAATLAAIEKKAELSSLNKRGVLALLTTHSSTYRAAVLASHSVSVERYTRLRVSYSFSLSTYLSSDEEIPHS